jgi:hypothetical protein
LVPGEWSAKKNCSELHKRAFEMKANFEAAKQLYQPNFEAMRCSLPDLGESLHNAAIDLSHDCTLERLDQMLARIKSAESNLVHLRKALVTSRG